MAVEEAITDVFFKKTYSPLLLLYIALIVLPIAIIKQKIITIKNSKSKK